MVAPISEPYVGNVHAPDQDVAIRRWIKPEQQLQQRGLAAPAAPHNCGDLSFGNHKVNLFQHERGIWRILEREVAQGEAFALGDSHCIACGGVLFVLQLVDLVDAQETDLCILCRDDKPDQLYQRGVQHPDDKLYRDHHPKSDLATDDSLCTIEGDQQVADALDKLCPEVLGVRDVQHFKVHPVKLRLDILPFPPFLLLVVVDLDVVYRAHRFDPITLVLRDQAKVFPVELLADVQESQYPTHIQEASRNKDVEDCGVIDEQDDPEGKEGERREDQVQRVVHDKTADPLVVLGTLQDVADELVLEERHRQLHQLDQVIGDQRDVYPCGDVEQQPIAHRIRNRYAYDDGDVGDQYDVDKVDVAGLDPHIDHRFRDKGEESLKCCGDDHHGKDCGEVLPERCEISDHVFEGLPAFAAFFAVVLQEVGHGFDGKDRANLFARFVPPFPELVEVIGGQSFGGIGDEYFVFGCLIDHDKMGLLPMYDAGQGDFCVEVLEVRL